MMPAEIVAAERCEDVRRAARAWATAGFLGAGSLRVIEDRYPDDRARLPIGFRILAFLLTALAVLGVFGFVLLIDDGGGSRAMAVLCTVFAALCALATELQRGPMRRADAGAELATALLTLPFAAIAVALWGIDGETTSPALTLGLLSLLAAALAARWGTGILGLLTALIVFAWLAQFAAGRLLWVLVAAASLGPLLIASRNPALSPSHRRGCWLAAGLCAIALYLALNPVSWDEAWIEDLREGGSATPSPFAATPRLLFALATVALPLIYIGVGFRRREHLLLMAGLVCLAGTIATVRHYYAVMPLEYALVVAGIAMLATALAGRRWLRAGAAGERHGWTADALFTDESRTAVVQAAISAAAFTPAPRATERPDLTGEGRFGGGGASGRY